jgi:hypothetical protein
MKFDLNIEMGNDAMKTPTDVGRALMDVAILLRGGRTSGPILDENGNTVGHWSIELDEADHVEGRFEG